MTETSTPNYFARISHWAVISGVVLTLLLPVGILIGINNPIYFYIFLLHLLLLMQAAWLSLRFAVVECEGVRWKIFILAAAFLCLISIGVQSVVLPVTAFDALIHHLAVPKWWVERGFIHEIKWHEWSYYPMLLNLAFTALISAGFGKLCALYHLLYLIIFAGVVGAFAKDKFPVVKFVSFILCITLPICLKLASTPLVDLGLALYGAIAVFSLFIWLDTLSDKIFYYGAIALGLSLATKYNALLVAVLMVPLFLITASKKFTPFQCSRRGATFFFIALVVFGPWLIKNFVWTGNPLFPLYKGLFGSPTMGAAVSGFSPIEHRVRIYGESWTDIALIPIKMILFGADGDPRFFDGVLTPVLLFALIPPRFGGKGEWRLNLYFYMVFYFLFAILLQSIRIRYLAPIFGVAVAISALNIFETTLNFRLQFRRAVLTAFAVIHFTVLGLYLWQLLYPGLAVERVQHLSKRIPEYSMIEYVNNNLPADSRTYLAYTSNAFYYYDKEVVSGGYFSGRLLIALLKRSETLNDFLSNLKQERITNLAVHRIRLKTNLEDVLDDKHKLIWNQFNEKHLRTLYQVGAYTLWQIV